MATKHSCKGCGEKFDDRPPALDHARDCLELELGESPGDYVERVEVEDGKQAFFTHYQS